MEAKYIAFSTAAKYFLWLKTALKDLQFPETPRDLFCYNPFTIGLPENHRISELSKYQDIHHHHIWELVYDQTVPLIYIRTTDNLADRCFIGLPEVQLSKLCIIP
jgi:hypothetical protein